MPCGTGWVDPRGIDSALPSQCQTIGVSYQRTKAVQTPSADIAGYVNQFIPCSWIHPKRVRSTIVIVETGFSCGCSGRGRGARQSGSHLPGSHSADRRTGTTMVQPNRRPSHGRREYQHHEQQEPPPASGACANLFRATVVVRPRGIRHIETGR